MNLRRCVSAETFESIDGQGPMGALYARSRAYATEVNAYDQARDRGAGKLYRGQPAAHKTSLVRLLPRQMA